MKAETKHSKSERSRVAGGAATAGGMNFQSAVTAICYVYMARGRPLGWLESLIVDVPVSVEAETGGPGDDIRLHLTSGELVEVQVKKGLQKGKHLWESLTGLAQAAQIGDVNFGVIAVCPNSSRNVRQQLATDIMRIGDGQTDRLSDIGAEWLDKLRALGIDPATVCNRIRLVTVPALATNHAAIDAARAELAHICANDDQVSAAWNSLCLDADALIERRGRRDLTSLLQSLRAGGIDLATEAAAGPASLLSRLARWNYDAHASFFVLGARQALEIDKDWIELTAVARQEETSAEPISLEEALTAYHGWERVSLDRDSERVAPETLGRFITRAVIVAGPGMGKSTLLKRIVRRYSEDAIPILRVRLASVAASMREGLSFEDAVFRHGLDGSGLTTAELRSAALSNWLLLGDGLDECGDMQEDVAAGVERFALGYPHSRVLVTTRPVGYRVAHFARWRHYDLAPLDVSDVTRHVSSLLAALLTEPSPGMLYERCESELETGGNRDIIGRTPLMIGMAAAILANGQSLGSTREKLFEQIFKLVDEIPRRAVSKPAADVVLTHFLNILGWNLTANPLLDCSRMSELCANDLARETGDPSLKAIASAERYLSYWEDAGLIERVGQGTTQVFSFIHKNFGEFAAARRLCVIQSDAQCRTVRDCIVDPQWNEVLRFAGMLGLAELVVAEFLDLPPSTEEWREKLVYMVRLLTEADPPPRASLRRPVLDRAFTLIDDGASQDEVALGIPLTATAKRFPEEVVPLASERRRSEHIWARLIAWNCLLAAGPEHYDLQELIATLEQIISSVHPGLEPSLAGGLILHRGESRDLAEELALKACVEIAERAQPEVADELVPKVLGHNNLNYYGFLRKANALIREKNWSYTLPRDWYPTSIVNPMEGWDEAQYRGDIFLLNALGADVNDASVEDPGPLLHLSAFVRISQSGKVAANDVWAWAKSFDPEPARAAIRTLAEISGLDGQTLREEAIRAKQAIIASLRKPEKEQWRYRLLHLVSDVDPPRIEWSKVRSTAVDPNLLEAAIHHPSQWIVWLAATLLENLLERSALESCVQRLYREGEGHALWAAAGLASELPGATAISLTLKRLKAKLKPGCRHLFNLLSELDTPLSTDVLDVLESGLFSRNVMTASAAASLLEKLARPVDGSPELGALPVLAERGWNYWLEHEEPWPTKGGAVPESPRGKLANAMLTMLGAGEQRVVTYLRDDRSDVRDVGSAALRVWLGASAANFSKFMEHIEKAFLPASHLSSVLRDMEALPIDQIARIEGLLNSASDPLRYNAMNILDPRFLGPKDIEIHTARLISDPNRQVRQRAIALRRSLAKT